MRKVKWISWTIWADRENTGRYGMMPESVMSWGGCKVTLKIWK